MKKYFFLLLASAALFVTSCSPFNVRTDYAETANFSSYKTYQFRVDDLKLNDLDKDRVLNEVAKNLQMKGLSASQTPDLVVNLKASHKKVEDTRIEPSFGMYGWGRPFGWGIGMSRAWTYDYNRGSLIIDIVDTKTGKLVWQGVGSGINVDSPKSKQKQIPAIVAEIMANYPPVKK